MKELYFLVHQAEDGGYFAQANGLGIFAEGENINELRKSIKSGIDCYFIDLENRPATIHLQLADGAILPEKQSLLNILDNLDPSLMTLPQDCDFKKNITKKGQINIPSK